MFRNKKPRQEMVFIPGSLSDYVPEDHILRRVDAVLDLSFLGDEVRGLYSDWRGRPCIEPERALRLMIAGFFHGVVHDRKLVREAQVNLAYLWFAGYELGERLPEHSSLTRIRQRWGEERFRKIFLKIVEQCAKAGLIGGETSHVDASLIRADVSWESLVKVHIDKVLTENGEEEIVGDEPPASGKGRAKGKIKKISRTDPDASMATSCKKVRLEPTYKQHTAVDDKIGLVIDVHVTSGDAHEGSGLRDQIDRIRANTGITPKMLTADAGYSSSRNYQMLEELGIEAVIPYEKPRMAKDGISFRRFKYDEKNEIIRCPMGKPLQKSCRVKNGWIYRAKTCDCRMCPLRAKCFSGRASARIVLIVDGYTALLRARRAKDRGWSDEKVAAYKRHRYQVEGIHGESKGEHGLGRAVRRGLANIRIQAYLTAMVIDLKRLADYASKGGFLPQNGLRTAVLALHSMILACIGLTSSICPPVYRFRLVR